MNSIWFYALIILLVAVNGELAILIAAGAAASGMLNPFAVFFAGIVGNVLSDSMWYAIGYYGRIDWLLTRLKWTGITVDKVDRVKSMVERDAGKLLAMAKLTNWMTIPVLLATGATRIPYRRWAPLMILSNIAIALVLVPIGYFMATSFLQVKNGLHFAGIGFTLLFILFVLISIRRHMNQKEEVAAEAQDLTTPK